MAQGVDFLQSILEQFELPQADAKQYSPLTLAYIGDSIFDAVVKTVVVESANCPANFLQKKTTKYVKAVAQAEMIEGLLPRLSEEEQSIYRRGKNAKPYNKAKNATYFTYLKATGFEALVGYLYLQGRPERAIELIRLGMTIIDTGKQEESVS